MKKFFPAMNFTLPFADCENRAIQDKQLFIFYFLYLFDIFFVRCSLLVTMKKHFLNRPITYNQTNLRLYSCTLLFSNIQIVCDLPFPIFCRFRVCALDDDVVAASVLNAEHRRLHVVDATSEQLDPIHQNLKAQVQSKYLNKIITVSILQTLHFFSYHKLAFKFKNYL